MLTSIAVDARYIGTTAATDSVTVDPAQVPKTDVGNYSSLFSRQPLAAERPTEARGRRALRSHRILAATGRSVSRRLGHRARRRLRCADVAVVGRLQLHSIARDLGSGGSRLSRADRGGDVRPNQHVARYGSGIGPEVTLWNSVANPDLESEKSLNKEIGYRWRSARHQLGNLRLPRQVHQLH